MPSMSSSVMGRIFRSDTVRESTGGSRGGFGTQAKSPPRRAGSSRGEGDFSGSRCGRTASPDGEQGHAERDERNPSEDDEPDRDVGEDLEHGGERGERTGYGLGRIPGFAGVRGREGIEWRDREDDRRELGPGLDRVDLTGQLLDLRAHYAKSGVDFQDLVDGARTREQGEVALFFRLLRGETSLEIDELVGDVLPGDVRGDHFAVELLQLAQRVAEAARRDTHGERRAAIVTLAGLVQVEDVSAQADRDRLRVVARRPGVLGAHRDVRGENQIAV